MKLYYSKGACSLAVRIVINELGIPCEYEAVNLQTKKTAEGADFYQINPKGAVPVLQLDTKEIFTENAAIQQYLADTHKAQHVLPPIGNMQRYHVLEWLNFVATDLHKGCSPLFNPNIPEQIKEDIFRKILRSKLSYVEKNLTKKYICGDEFTLVDGYLFVILNWMPGLKIDLAEFPMLTSYFARMKTHPSVAKSLKEEGIVEKQAS
ncbi:MAG: glutathione transferase GstA [Gammaproteobacteria bacterium]